MPGSFRERERERERERKGGPLICYEGTVVNITKRKFAEESQKTRNEVIENKSCELDKLNITLNFLLKKRENDIADIQKKIASNVKESILPYVEKLRKSRLDNAQNSYLEIIEHRLNNVISPFLHTINSHSLTPKELRVASLIRDGKTSKEIASLLFVCEGAIEFHRNNIRKKLGLKNKKRNLQSHLLSMK